MTLTVTLSAVTAPCAEPRDTVKHKVLMCHSCGNDSHPSAVRVCVSGGTPRETRASPPPHARRGLPDSALVSQLPRGRARSRSRNEAERALSPRHLATAGRSHRTARRSPPARVPRPLRALERAEAILPRSGCVNLGVTSLYPTFEHGVAFMLRLALSAVGLCWDAPPGGGATLPAAPP